MNHSASIPKLIALLLALPLAGILSGCREAPASTENFVGIWHYDGKLVWSYKVSGSIGHDENAVLSVARDEFKLREADGSITVFTRLKTP